MCNTTL